MLSGRVMPQVSNHDFAMTQTGVELMSAHMLVTGPLNTGFIHGLSISKLLEKKK